VFEEEEGVTLKRYCKGNS